MCSRTMSHYHRLPSSYKESRTRGMAEYTRTTYTCGNGERITEDDSFPYRPSLARWLRSQRDGTSSARQLCYRFQELQVDLDSSYDQSQRCPPQ
ncbi:unnamed protein product, partial [Mycena citricolor]